MPERAGWRREYMGCQRIMIDISVHFRLISTAQQSAAVDECMNETTVRDGRCDAAVTARYQQSVPGNHSSSSSNTTKQHMKRTQQIKGKPACCSTAAWLLHIGYVLQLLLYVCTYK